MLYYININVCMKFRCLFCGLCIDEGYLCLVFLYRFYDELKSVRYENLDGLFEI